MLYKFWFCWCFSMLNADIYNYTKEKKKERLKKSNIRYLNTQQYIKQVHNKNRDKNKLRASFVSVCSEEFVLKNILSSWSIHWICSQNGAC